MKEKLLNIKYRLIALWWFLTRKNFYLLSYNDREGKSLETYHDYLVVDTKHGVCVIHAESCPCHKKK